MSDPQPTPHFLTRALVFLVTSALMGGLGYWYLHRETAAPGAKAGPRAGALTVVTGVVGRENFATDIQSIGTVVAMESIDLMPNVTEQIIGLHFEDGQQVKKGDLLATLSDAEEQAALQSAKTTLAEEEREISRLTALVKDGAAPEARLQERQTLAQVAKHRIQEAEAKVADRRLLAPFDGVLGLRRISVGALVTPTTVISRLDKIDVVRIDFSVPETALPHLKPDSEIIAKADGAGGKDFKGKLAHIDSRIDPVTRSVIARAEVKNENLALRPGMLVTVRLAVLPRDSLSIPERALVPVGAQAYVFTIKEDKAKRLEIKPGRRKPGTVEVLSGVEEGQVVITDGIVGLQDGMPVKVARSFKGPAKAFNPEQPRVTQP